LRLPGFEGEWEEEKVSDLLEFFPTNPSKAEQTKIAHLLRLIDNRISTQSQIIENLQSLIKGLIFSFVKNKEAIFN
jgi:restriction endonuclease S subunit